MKVDRRELLTGAAAVAAILGGSRIGRARQKGVEEPMYGLIGKMMAAPGKRDELIAILLEGTTTMPGCLAYLLAKDASDEDAIWITEVWDTEASHAGSLQLAEVQATIAKARPLIAGFGERVVTEPVGGVGLAGAIAR